MLRARADDHTRASEDARPYARCDLVGRGGWQSARCSPYTINDWISSSEGEYYKFNIFYIYNEIILL